MNKRLVLILVAILVVLLAAIAVIELVKPDKKPDNLIVNSNEEIGVHVDLETGSIVDETFNNSDKTPSKDNTSGNEVVGEGVGSGDIVNSDETTNSDKEQTSSESKQQTMDGFKPWH